MEPAICPGEDVLYMRFFKNGDVLRVARVDTHEGVCLALYPSGDPNKFYTEAFRNVDDESPKGEIGRSEIQDKIWLRLLDGASKKDILKGYAESYGDTYRFTGESFSTFKIAESKEKQS